MEEQHKIYLFHLRIDLTSDLKSVHRERENFKARTITYTQYELIYICVHHGSAPFICIHPATTLLVYCHTPGKKSMLVRPQCHLSHCFAPISALNQLTNGCYSTGSHLNIIPSSLL